ncbi:MAG: hypothetical protein NTW21_28420 [Verrucomicrobia bacterium]|nr:hypothetical protein [Verrucomicrobiota bacterium]
MIPLPNPLHPAIVHFPIVLILIGALVAVVAMVLRRWHLPWLAAVLLITGAAGAFAAARTGSQQAEMVGEISESAETLLDQHEEWGERTRTIAVAAAILALVSASLARFPKVARSLSVATALVAGAAAYAVAETGHLGGRLVYKHGVGINTAAGNNPEATKSQPSD